jgi:hypothetical protein
VPRVPGNVVLPACGSRLTHPRDIASTGKEVRPTMRTPLVVLAGRRCPCGASIEHYKAICRKCDMRARWRRRKAPYPGDADEP